MDDSLRWATATTSRVRAWIFTDVGAGQGSNIWGQYQEATLSASAKRSVNDNHVKHRIRPLVHIRAL